MLALLFIGSGSVIAVAVFSSSSTSTTTTTSTSTTTSSSSTTTTTTTSTTTSTTTTTTSTSTSTTLCGGYFMPACPGGTPCDSGFVMNSDDVCVPYECASTTESGNEGCGAGNLNLPPDWCQPGAYNPFSKRTNLLQ